MSDLIKALQILLKYGDPDYPTHCEHDVLHICGIHYYSVSEEDRETLKELGFILGDDESFQSFKYGSA